MKIFKYLLLSCLFLMTSDSLGAAADVLNEVELKAVKLGDLNIIKSIVEQKGVNAVDEAGNPILCIVLDMSSIVDVDNKILKAKLDAAKYFIIEEQVNIEGRNKDGLTPFLLAVNNFMINSQETNDEHYHREFNRLRFNFIQFLIHNKSDLNAVDNEDRTFLDLIIKNSDKELAVFLCSLGVITQEMYDVTFFKNIVPSEQNAAGFQAPDSAASEDVQLDSQAKEIIDILATYLSYKNGALEAAISNGGFTVEALIHNIATFISKRKINNWLALNGFFYFL